MLVAAQYNNNLDFNPRTPRVISEIRKTCNTFVDFRPKLTGDLLVKNDDDNKWWPRKAAVRNGQLQIAGCHAEGAPSALRLPLRHLSLRAGPLPNSLSLCKGQNAVITIQTANEHSFDVWVKTLAIELIRQTPLDDVKYLDIFTLASCWERKANDKDCNSNYLKCAPPLEEVDEEENRVERLLKKCQNVDNYVPVKEKLILFESLCKLGRKVRSTEDVSCRIGSTAATKRARSMHDLSNIQTQSAVRQICKYFEVKNEEESVHNNNNNNHYNNKSAINKYGTMTRYNRSDSQLDQKIINLRT